MAETSAARRSPHGRAASASQRLRSRANNWEKSDADGYSEKKIGLFMSCICLRNARTFFHWSSAASASSGSAGNSSLSILRKNHLISGKPVDLLLSIAQLNSSSVPDSALPLGEPKRWAMMPMTNASEVWNFSKVCLVISSWGRPTPTVE